VQANDAPWEALVKKAQRIVDAHYSLQYECNSEHTELLKLRYELNAAIAAQKGGAA
jgi:hypothetical protein